MLAQHIRDTLRQHGFRITAFKTIDYGHQIRLLEGAIINVYDRSKVLVQGKPSLKPLSNFAWFVRLPYQFHQN